MAQRYGLNLTIAELNELNKIANNLGVDKRTRFIENRGDNRQLYRINFKGHYLFVIYDNYAKRIVTALPDKVYFKRLKLLDDDRQAILSGERTAIFHVSDRIFSTRPGTKIKLYVKSEIEPFAVIRVKSRGKLRKLGDLAGKVNEGFYLPTREDICEYLTERYGDSITLESGVRAFRFQILDNLTQ